MIEGGESNIKKSLFLVVSALYHFKRGDFYHRIKNGLLNGFLPREHRDRSPFSLILESF